MTEGYDTVVNVPVGLVEKGVVPEESRVPWVASNNSVYAKVGVRMRVAPVSMTTLA